MVHGCKVRSTHLYGQFLTGPNHRTHIQISYPDIRSALLYGQFSLEKTMTLQAGSNVSDIMICSKKCSTDTVLVLRMAHRIWKETKQEPGTAGPGNMLGCCLNYFNFLCAILSTSTVQIIREKTDN